MEYTLSIIKPDATKRDITGKINTIIEDAGLKIVAQKRTRFSNAQAIEFYKEYEEKSFFEDLIDQICSGPIIAQVLKGPKAIETYKKLMGSTNPQTAEDGTIRKTFGMSITPNSVHGSDSIEDAKREISFFFSQTEIYE